MSDARWRKHELRDRAREMRKAGASLSAIHAKLGVAKSTASLWVRDIALDQEHERALRAADPALNKQQLGQRTWSRMCRDRRSAAQLHGRNLARAGGSMLLAGCMLFWAEGSKDRNGVTFTNADVHMVRFFLRFLRECYGVRDDAMSLSVNCHLGNGLSLDEIERWWLDELGLPEGCLRAGAVNRASRSSKGVRKPLIHGTARLVVSSTFIVQSIYGAIQEFVGCSRPEWLDLGLVAPHAPTVSPPSTSSVVPVT